MLDEGGIPSFEIENNIDSPSAQSSLIGSASSRCDVVSGLSENVREVTTPLQKCGGGVSIPRQLAFAIAVALTCVMSGGLIFGVGPFEDAMIKEYGFSDGEAEEVWTLGFQIFVFGTGLFAPLLDVLGPRCAAAGGLIVEIFGHHLMTSIENVQDLDSNKTNEVVRRLGLAYGLVGFGGNFLMMAAIQFSELLPNNGTCAAVVSGAYQAAGFVFMLLSLDGVEFKTFFSLCRFVAFGGLVVVAFLFPDSPFASTSDDPRLGLRISSLPCMNCRRLGRGSMKEVVSDICNVLLKARTWLFILCFSWAATCAAWAMGAFYGHVSTLGKENHNEALSDSLNLWSAVIMNATFFFSPCIGAMIDWRGFGLPIFCLAAVVAWTTVAMWLLPLTLQWFTLFGINLLQALTYCIQLTYIAKAYPSDKFGIMMSISTLGQSAINLIGHCVTSPGYGVAIFVPPLTVFWIWGILECSRTYPGDLDS